MPSPLRSALLAAAAVFLLPTAASTFAAAQETPTLIVLRADPPKGKGEMGTPAPLVQADIAQIKVGGKPAPITAWTPLLKGPTTLQLYLLIDKSIEIGIHEQFDDINRFFSHLPATTEISVGYMERGKAKTEQPFTTDRKLVAAALHVPTDIVNPKNDNGSPYVCLADLATHWEKPDPAKVRAVLMITDGVDRYNTNQGSDALNPNVDTAANTMSRFGIPVYSLYYMDPVPPPGKNTGGMLEGQTLMDQLADGTAGKALYQGQYAPSSFQPLLTVLYDILDKEVVATVTAKGNGYKSVDVKTDRKDIKITAPLGVMIGNVMPKK
jgi:hypothetical protein